MKLLPALLSSLCLAALVACGDGGSSSGPEAPHDAAYAFGYALENAPGPSAGCGGTSSLDAIRTVENGQHFRIAVEEESYRDFFATLPADYDSTKPYKILIALQASDGTTEDLVHHSPSAEFPSPYYGQQALDTAGDYIFVAPITDHGLWAREAEDHRFVDEMISALFDNYCVDTTRVFVTGFDAGAQFAYSLAMDLQERLRAVVTYAITVYDVWLPDSGVADPGRYDAKELPVAWMNVHGMNDDRNDYHNVKETALPRILRRNLKADADTVHLEGPREDFGGGTGHVCHDFKSVDERFPIKWCSWNGGHQWTAYDDGDWQNTWVPEVVHDFFERF